MTVSIAMVVPIANGIQKYVIGYSYTSTEFKRARGNCMSGDLIKRTFKAYDGTEPYVFVSYARKDKDVVHPEIAKWHSHGIRVWCDVGIPPTVDYLALIDQKLESAALCVVFISKNSMDSNNVKDELHAAIEMEKPFLQIFLEDVELPRGVRMRLQRFQYLERHKMPEEDYRGEILGALATYRQSETPPSAVPDETEPPVVEDSKATAKPVVAAPPAVPTIIIPSHAPDIRVNPIDGMEMILIPEGSFTRGSNDNPDEQPINLIRLSSYRIGKSPVTVAQYRLFCDETHHNMPAAPEWGWAGDHPIVNINWHEAALYCHWAGGRLPTESEWEKAARGTDSRVYPWGSEWDSNKCRCSLMGYGDAVSTISVGSFPDGASPFGCLDMAGNVWEWCSDWHQIDYYSISPDSNPTGPEHGTFRSVRGGAWLDCSPFNFRTACRDYHLPDTNDVCVGFRPVTDSNI